MTIEEKAELHLQYERDFLGNNLSENMVCRAYVKGAAEQKAIDIDKACEWLKNRFDFDGEEHNIHVFFRDCIEDFRKAMED